MSEETITVTGQDVLDAMEKNGLPQSKLNGFWPGFFNSINEDDYILKKPAVACIWGQAAINLSVNPFRLYGAFTEQKKLDTLDGLDYWNNVASRIGKFNDDYATTYEETLEFAKTLIDPSFTVTLPVIQYVEE